ncbi:MAG: hypothetical protein IPI49_31205 [Myxococcales bacterium]|nr:hypothetical protein [Myxococcales bacterium]
MNGSRTQAGTCLDSAKRPRRAAAVVSLAASLAVSLAAALAAGCDRSAVISRPQEKKLDVAYDTLFLTELQGKVEDGDIVLRRGYAVLSDMITLVTPGMQMSHAAIYDATTKTVIEAVNSGVREHPIDAYVRGSHRLVVVRLAVSTSDKRAAVVSARSVIGSGFDHLGFIGMDDPERFYCSELVAWAYRAKERGFRPDDVIAPGELVRLGAIVYDSGERGARPMSAVAPYWK